MGVSCIQEFKPNAWDPACMGAIVRHTRFWRTKVRFPKIYMNKAFKFYYTLFKHTTPKEDKYLTRPIRKFNLI
jgi:hypothetical protein